MKLEFVKYQGAGNDFVIVDMRENYYELTNEQVAFLCHRRLGIGADGLMTVGLDENGADFYMRYWNSDGGESTMCGNGGRCIAHFANSLGLGNGKNLVFNAVDGEHSAQILQQDVIKLKMIDAPTAEKISENEYFINTGSPHYVAIVEDVETLDLPNISPELRYKYNANVNFVDPKTMKIRTWERGVEGETLACGTGATATAIVLWQTNIVKETSVKLHTRCSQLQIDFTPTQQAYKEVYLTGEAKKVFEGVAEIL